MERKENYSRKENTRRLSDYLFNLRTASNLTLKQVEEISKSYDEQINFHYLSKVERGQIMPSLPKLLSLSRVYKVNPANFIDILELESYEKLEPEVDEYQQCKQYGVACTEHGDYNKAFAAFNKCLSLIEKEPDTSKKKSLASEIHLCIGGALRGMGKLSLAREELEKALLNVDISDHLKMRVYCFMSGLYSHQKNFHLASLYNNEALRMAKSCKDERIVANAYITRANIIADSDPEKDAEPYYRKGISLYKKLRLTPDLVTSFFDYGHYLIQKGRYDEAISIIEEYSTIAKKEGFKKHYAHSIQNLGIAFFHLKEYERAKIHLSEALRMSREYEYISIAFVCLFYLWKIAIYEGNQELQKTLLKSLKFYRVKLELKFDEVEEFDFLIGRMR
ncbi:MAG: tetratricopeptide repeat protein [Acidobacteriota bacterium]